MKFVMEIETGNAAFDGDDLRPELARIVANSITTMLHGHTGSRLFDINGNAVGKWEFRNK